MWPSLVLPVNMSSRIKRGWLNSGTIVILLNIAQCQSEHPTYHVWWSKDDFSRHETSFGECIGSVNTNFINYSLTSVTLSQHVIPNRHQCDEKIWMMRKSSLVLPVKYPNQARLIKQRNYRHSLEYRSMPVRTPLLSCMMEEARMIFPRHET